MILRSSLILVCVIVCGEMIWARVCLKNVLFCPLVVCCSYGSLLVCVFECSVAPWPWCASKMSKRLLLPCCRGEVCPKRPRTCFVRGDLRLVHQPGCPCAPGRGGDHGGGRPAQDCSDVDTYDGSVCDGASLL